jgi:glyoxylase-like metal-dependent hydrolase (beta-lactamase superfamily II)/rhodanese-related sulfurtransferase
MKRPKFTLPVLLAAALAAASRPTGGTEIDDAESGTHGFEAARYQLVDTYEFPGFKVLQYDLAVLSHFSYLVTSGNEALLVDPGRDAFTYLEAAREQGVRITGVWLSHSHADFVAGHMEVAARLGVPIYISRKANAAYEHEPLEEGDELNVGEAVLRFLATPGHTPDSMCAVVSSARASGKPLAVLSGDTLFIGSVGRPDLLGGQMSASTLAGMMYDTWHNELAKLPDDVLVLPAHGAGSLCGAHLSDEPVSTIGEERVRNQTLGYTSRGEFIAAVLEGLPEAPQYFAHNAGMNREGPPPAEWEFKDLPLVEPAEELTDPARFYVIDVREADDYAAGHIPGSVNIGLRGRFETWSGIMVPWDAEKVVAGSPDEIREALYRLNRIGYTARAVDVGAWQQAGLPLAANERIGPTQLHDEMEGESSPLVVDVRLPDEWTALRIGRVINIPLGHLAAEASLLDRGERIVTVCNSAYRSSLAVGVLERQGFTKVSSLAGGSEAWVEAGLPVQETQCPIAATPAPERYVRLAERIPAAELKRTMMDRPGTFTLVDIRPAEHFADYSLPGSENVHVADLLDNPAWLTGVGPLVVVDRDGSLAMQVAGILSQKTERPIKALYGGLAAYWDEADVGALLRTSPVGGPPAPSAPSPTPQKPASKPTKRSAGC